MCQTVSFCRLKLIGFIVFTLVYIKNFLHHSFIHFGIQISWINFSIFNNLSLTYCQYLEWKIYGHYVNVHYILVYSIIKAKLKFLSYNSILLFNGAPDILSDWTFWNIQYPAESERFFFFNFSNVTVNPLFFLGISERKMNEYLTFSIWPNMKILYLVHLYSSLNSLTNI